MSRLYLQDTSTFAPGYAFTTRSSTLAPADATALAAMRDLTEVVPTGTPRSPSVNSLPITAEQHILVGLWISPPLTGITTLQANSWHVGFTGRQSNLNANMFGAYCLTVVRQNDTVRGVVYDATTPHGTEFGISTPAPGQIIQFGGSTVVGIQPTDRLLFEAWAVGSQGLAAAYNIRGMNFGGQEEIIEGTGTDSPASYVETPQGGLFDVAPPPVGSTTLHFRATQDNIAGFSRQEQSAAMTPLDQAQLQGDLHLQPNPAPLTPSPVRQLASSANLAAQNTYLGNFVSNFLQVSSIPAGTIEIGFAQQEEDARANARFAFSIQVRKADDTVRGYLYDSAVGLGLEPPVAAMKGAIIQVASSAVTGILTTDKIVVEVWAVTTGQGINLPFTRTFAYDGGDTVVDGASQTSPRSYIIFPVSGLTAAVTALNVSGGITPAGAQALKGATALAVSGGATPAATLTLTTQPTLSTGQLAGSISPTGFVLLTKVGGASAPGEGSGKRQPWLEFCGQEIMNAARTINYIDLLQPKISKLDDVHPVLFHTHGELDTFVHPATDPAPWYDPAVPQSAEFLGLIGVIKEVSTPTDRTVTNLARGGAQLGGDKLGPRTLVVDGFLIATTWAGQQYGREWLANALAGCQGCGLCDATVYLWAPTLDRLDSSDGRYQLFDCGVTDGPKELAAPKCDELLHVSFTITSERGEWFAAQQLVAGMSEIPEPGFPAGCVPFDVWFCTQPISGVQAYIIPPRIGVTAVNIAIDATEAGANGIEIGLFQDCVGDTAPLRRLVVDSLPAGSYLTIDSARRRVTYVSPLGEVLDGIGYLIPDDNLDIEWMELGPCDSPGCVIVRKLANCSDTGGVTVGVITQLRTR